MNDEHYEGALLEEIKDQNKAVIEAVGMMQDSVKKIPKMSKRLEKLEHDITAIRLATINNNSDFKLLKIRTEKLDDIVDQAKSQEKRITKLEAAIQN